MGEIIQGLDVVDLIKYAGRKNKTYQAMFLQELENILSKDSPEFMAIRKAYLDNTNEYTRSFLRAIFGDDFEGK